MKLIQNAYINALLADASYVRLQQGENGDPVGRPLLSGVELITRLSTRMTSEQASYIVNNFEVLDQHLSSDDGFDAVAWRIRPGSELAGKDNENAGRVYVSMRGTQGLQDVYTDIALALFDAARGQIVDMINWWLRVTTPAGEQARQIRNVTTVTVVPGLPDPTVEQRIELADTVLATGNRMESSQTEVMAANLYIPGAALLIPKNKACRRTKHRQAFLFSIRPCINYQSTYQ